MEAWKRNLMVCWFCVLVISSGGSQLAPILPLYVEHLGINNIARIEQWSGIAFGVTFISLAIFSPIWGSYADKYGRKPMLLRASLSLTVIMFCMGFAYNVYQFIFLRMLQGALSGFIAAAITLVATQTPMSRAGWALGIISTASVGGTLLGPLVGGFLAETLGLRSVFLSTGVLDLIAFIATYYYINENFTAAEKKTLNFNQIWKTIPNHGFFIALCITTFVVQFALMSIEPIITVYISQLVPQSTHIALISGIVFSASGLASVFAAPRLGRLSDKIGPPKIILVGLIVSGIIFFPQAFVGTAWQLGILRFLLGLATAGLLPAINTLVKRSVPDSIVGRVFGYTQSAQFLGVFGGSLVGGQVASLFGIHYVFFLTGALMLLSALLVYKTVYCWWYALG
ncbi:tetracycline resistance protein teta/multidrug resistance protein mdtg [Lucifera butyrica]|uniref:Tetracycline resistance protein teta/multidrug resistance protein mdtg n=1 Tax=Lucifera butyrica TaxID=1351585 RepID=A0A498R8M3_9FIRM|nr:multidrug efflux MFS transporter [Lucifera butyrica]VBB09046.1 tetracycline resistance protein teta/multidrug resistance protein mdtg [Lucifera butyrica]